jgi:signal transduction histidine kinase
LLDAVRKGKPLLVRRNSVDGERRNLGNGAALQPALNRLGLRSLAAVPLVSHDRVLGAITVATGPSGRQYNPVDLVVAEDLARRAAVALENCLLYARSEQAVRARDAVLGVVSHDLRNPLNTIHMAASVLLETSEERRSGNVRGLEIIRRSVQQMNRMIKDLLDASSIDAGRFHVAQSYADVAALLCQASELLGPLAAEKSIQLDCESSQELTKAWVDSDQMLRVFSNLIGNAIKFTPEGGTICLRAEPSVDSIVFSVRDSGAGIAATQLPHVFDRYWQGIRGDRRGAGLGLAIAKGIVEAHGGRIWVDSTPGVGSTFSFSIPCEHASEEYAEAELAAAS